MNAVSYLMLSVTLSSGRNIITKKTAVSTGKPCQFYFSQTMLFAAAVLLLLVLSGGIPDSAQQITLYLGLGYGVLLILSQWMLTKAMSHGSTSICSVVYSMGFLIPTVSGVLFWNESFTVFQLLGILSAVAVILLSAKRNPGETNSKTSFVPYILVAAAASGGLGILQKLQQSSEAAGETQAFLLIAFTLALSCSGIRFLLCKEKSDAVRSNIVLPPATGLLFGGANFCNTVLTGQLKSAVFFPVQNVSTILISTVLGLLLFHEKPGPKSVGTILLGILVILLFSI